MNAEETVAAWLDGVRGGDDAAAQELWNRYFERLVSLARTRLQGCRCRDEIAEDVALSAFDGFCRAAKDDRYPNLNDRESLWRLLMKITLDKTIDEQRRLSAQKRGGGQVRGESVFDDESGMPLGLDRAADDGPSPQTVAVFTEQVTAMLDQLDTEDLKSVAVARMEGYSIDEIATMMGCAKRTVERRLHLIRRKWQA